MNRFVLDRNPVKAAYMHCDKHVVKMILEEAQMLSTVHRRYGSTDDRLYRATHVKHPCTLWAGETQANYRWAYQLLVSLCAEYTWRYGGKKHATERLLDVLRDPPAGLPAGPLTPFPQAMPDHLRGPDPVEAYRRYYIAEKARFARWTVQRTPHWWPENSGLTRAVKKFSESVDS